MNLVHILQLFFIRWSHALIFPALNLACLTMKRPRMKYLNFTATSVVILMKPPSLAAPEDVILTTSSVANDDNMLMA